MTGQDLLFWLEDLWFDLMHFEQAELLGLIFRLFLLFIAVVILWNLGKTLWKKLSNVIGQLWELILVPIRFPQKRYRKTKRRKESQKQQAAWKQSQKEQEERAESQQKEDEKRRRKERKAIERALRLD